MFAESALERRMKMMLVCLKMTLGRKVGFDLPLLSHQMVRCKFRKCSELASIFDFSRTYNFSPFLRVL